MACVKEYTHNGIHVKIMDDDLASPEEQEQIMESLRAIAWEIKLDVASRKEEEARKNEPVSST